MPWYPYVEPIPVALTWSGESLAAILVVTALFVAGALALLALRAAGSRRAALPTRLIPGPAGGLSQTGGRWREARAGRLSAARSALGSSWPMARS